MTTLIIFLLVLTALVFVHELGHFLAAKLFKVRVDEFAIGFPPRIASRKIKGTVWALNLLPLGGYVKIFGENPDDQPKDEHGNPIPGAAENSSPDNFQAKAWWKQIIILAAGVIFNIIFAWVLISIIYMIGSTTSIEGLSPQIQEKYAHGNSEVVISMVKADSPADRSGLKAGDKIMSVSDTRKTISLIPGADVDEKNKADTSKIQDVQNLIANAPRAVVFNVSRVESPTSTRTIAYTVAPEPGIVEGKKAVGISMSEVAFIKMDFKDSIYYGTRATIMGTEQVAVGLYKFIGNVFKGDGGLKDVTGPVGIAQVVGQASADGFLHLLEITAIISINLAIINLVPFPALDGGRIVVVFLEAVSRRKVPARVINVVNAVGFLLLILLMIIVTIKDVRAL